ncbi:MAG: FAD:protein FMN transferase [Dysgonamonadaceae bacterium]
MSASRLYKAQTRWLFHAHIKLKLSAFFEDGIFDELYNVLEQIDKKYNSYVEGSVIDKINRNAGEFVQADEVSLSFLKKLSLFSGELNGEYDITIMPLLRLWGFYKKYGHRIPSPEEIRNVLPLIDYRQLQIQGNQVRINPGQEIITGSFLKAFAVDCLVDYMRGIGISDAIINAGGSTIYALSDESHPYWQVDVGDAIQPEQLLFSLRLSNASYSTSSNENTYLEIDGRKYGHIISPLTGYPSENRQVGIVSSNSFLGDVISTGLFNMDKNTFLQTILRLSDEYGVEGFLVDKHGDIVFSPGFTKYIIV